MLTKTDLKQIRGIVQSETQEIVKKENKILGDSLSKRIDIIDKKLDKAIDFLDRDYIKLLKRLERVEKHLGLEPISP